MSDPTASRDIARAAAGAAVIARRARDERDAASLAYVALYACGYAGGGTDLERYRSVTRRWRDEIFLAGLRAEVDDTIEVGGWTELGRDDGRVLLARGDGVRVFAHEHELVGSGGRDRPISVVAPALQAARMPGFVVRRGRGELDDRADLSRLYLNIRPGAAAWALGPLARGLDRAGVPHRTKVLAHPAAYARRDSCVVYLPAEREAAAVALVRREVAAAGPGILRPGVPRLTGRVAPGIGVADEPSDLPGPERSHGQWVAALFREASRGTTDPQAIAREVRARLRELGRDPRRPHRRGLGRNRSSPPPSCFP